MRAGREAFEALHRGYATSIYSLALRIVDDPQEAQDVAQEVLIKVFRGLPESRTDLNLPAWLYRVTVNAAFDQVRARKRRPVTVTDDAAGEPVAGADEFERAELSQRVESTLRELPKRQQLALVLRDVHGLSVGETASVLGLTKGSADVLLSRARAGFRRVFLAGVGSFRGRCDMADKALAAGVGRGGPVPASLREHSRTCPDCRRAVELWGAAPIGLGLLLPQVVLPAKLSLGATLAAAQAAGVAVSAGASAAGGAATGAVTAGASAAGGSSAAVSAGGAGVLAALGSATGVKIATLAVVAATAVGITGAATHHGGSGIVPAGVAVVQAQDQSGPSAEGAGGPGSSAANDGRRGAGARARLLERAHRGVASAPFGARGRRDAAVEAGGGRGAQGDGTGASQGAGGSGARGTSGGGNGTAAGGQSSGSAVSGAGAGSSGDSGSGGGAASGGASGQAGGSGSGGGADGDPAAPGSGGSSGGGTVRPG